MRTRDEIIAEEVIKHRPARVLDIAYAHGPNAVLAGVAKEVVGIDPIARPAPFPVTRCDVNAELLPFPDESFDVVTMGCVLAHLSKPLTFLKEVHRVLAPGGTLILMSPNPQYYWENIINIFYSRFKKRVSKSKHVEHFFEFSRYAMRTILERSGFTLEKEIGATFVLVKANLRLDVSKYPGLAYEIIYVAKKTGTPESFTVIEDEKGTIINLKTDIFS